jgi:hypothetical protein
VDEAFELAFGAIDDILRENAAHPVRVQIIMNVIVYRTVTAADEERGDVEPEQVLTTIYLPSNALYVDEIEQSYLSTLFDEKLQNFTNRTSNFLVRRIESIDMHLLRYEQIPYWVGHSYFPLPSALKNKNAVVNVCNTGDNDCFRYAILSVIHYDDLTDNHNRTRPQSYASYLNEIDFSGITFPFQTKDLARFHLLNNSLYINLLQWDNVEKKAKVLLVSRHKDPARKVINILLVSDDGNERYHYVGVPHLDRLLNCKGAHHHNKRHYCVRCLQPFCTEATLSQH